MTDETQNAEIILADQKLFPWWLILLWGILTLLVGCMFLFWPGQTMEMFIIFLGAYWLVGGIFTVGSLFVDRSNMGWKIFLAIINIIAGLLILAYPLYSTVFVFTFLIIFIGFWACFIGAAHIYQAYTAKDAGNAVLGIISIIFGILLLLNPFIAATLLPFVFGGFAVVSGLASVYVGYAAKGMQATAPA